MSKMILNEYLSYVDKCISSDNKNMKKPSTISFVRENMSKPSFKQNHFNDNLVVENIHKEKEVDLVRKNI